MAVIHPRQHIVHVHSSHIDEDGASRNVMIVIDKVTILPSACIKRIDWIQQLRNTFFTKIRFTVHIQAEQEQSANRKKDPLHSPN